MRTWVAGDNRAQCETVAADTGAAAWRSGPDKAREGAGMQKKVRVRLSPLAVIVPIGVCLLIGALTYTIAVRAGYPPILAAIIAGVIGLLWLGFLIGRLLG